jgi:hypothetical protein
VAPKSLSLREKKNGGAKAASSGLPFLSVESRAAEQDSSPRPEAARSGGDLEEKAKKKRILQAHGRKTKSRSHVTGRRELESRMFSGTEKTLIHTRVLHIQKII